MRTQPKRIGFVGLGTMGKPMCRHMSVKALGKAIEKLSAYDIDRDAVNDMREFGILPAASIGDLVEASDAVHICLPGGAELQSFCRGSDGLLALARPGQAVIDHGTSPVPLTRELAAAFADLGVSYADAPITRTRQAAEAGTLVTLFGGSADLLEGVRPAIETFSSEIVHCGDVGAGQIFKQLNNMVLFQTVTALAEALATARRAGVDGGKLFAAFTSGSADSFALRNHGMKSLVPGDFPERAFAIKYAAKDLDYALELAESLGLELTQAAATRQLFERALRSGLSEAYFPAVLHVVDGRPE